MAARGEIADLKDTINQMITALRTTTAANAEQGWLDSNLARIGGLLQGQRDLGEVCSMIMNEVAPLVNAQVGAFFLVDPPEAPVRNQRLVARATAWWPTPGRRRRDGGPPTFRLGEGLVGQVAARGRQVLVEEVPVDYLSIRSGVGATAPRAWWCCRSCSRAGCWASSSSPR